jgi:hypothetical protein
MKNIAGDSSLVIRQAPCDLDVDGTLSRRIIPRVWSGLSPFSARPEPKYRRVCRVELRPLMKQRLGHYSIGPSQACI